MFSEEMPPNKFNKSPGCNCLQLRASCLQWSFLTCSCVWEVFTCNFSSCELRSLKCGIGGVKSLKIKGIFWEPQPPHMLAQVLVKMGVLAGVLAQAMLPLCSHRGQSASTVLRPAPPFLPALAPALFENSRFGVLYQVARISTYGRKVSIVPFFWSKFGHIFCQMFELLKGG